MLRNLSYNTLELKLEIDQVTGRSFSWWRRLQLRGIGSQRYLLVEASQPIAKLFNRDGNANYCNIELRERGIILRFRSKQEAFGWIIPYRSLQVFKAEKDFAIHAEGEFVRLKAAQNAKLDQGFIRKLIILKSEDTRESGFYSPSPN